MTLRARLALGFFTIALLLAIPLAAALSALESARRATEQVADGAFSGSLLIAKVREATNEVRRAELSIFAQPTDTARDYLDHTLRRFDSLADSVHAYRLDSLQASMRALHAKFAQFIPIEIAAIHDHEGDLVDRIEAEQYTPVLAAMERQITAAEERLREQARRQVRATAEAARRAVLLAGALVAFAIVAGAVVAVWLTRSISRPVRDLERGMAAVADGKFEHRLSVAPGRDDEFGRLAASFESMAGQLAELDKIKAEFVSIASHELKTPINVLMGYLKLLEENLYGPMSDRQLEVVNIMQTQSEAMARLVQHLLDVSRFQAGGARLEVRPTTLRGFLSQLESTYDVLALQRGITFTVVASPTLPDVVTWDVDRINEVIGNLLSNAFKFTKEGGRVELVVSALESSVYIEVRDSGVGIAPAQLPHIFDKFFQADNQAGAPKGTGLGLAISKEIVEAHGGSIAAESEVGVGTKFSIMLPVAASTPGGAESDKSDAAVDAPAEAGAPV